LKGKIMATENKKPITVGIIGAGGRGSTFADIIRRLPKMAKVIAVAEPLDDRRQAMAKKFKISPSLVFKDWREFLKEKRVDAAVVSTMDREHAAPAIACMEMGVDILLEKPMAVTLEDCQAIAETQTRTGRIVIVCHSMRYKKALRKIKEMVDKGVLGDIVTLDQIEQVGYWHYAHSFIRGKWAKEASSSFMLLAKSCHDLDYISYLVGKPCRKVASFGSLTHFRRENAPAGSTDYCTGGCKVERSCPFSAIKIYTTGNLKEWPPATVSSVHTRKAHLEGLRKSPYDRCVWRADNDVVDHQVVIMEFEGKMTATFTMTGFTQNMARRLRINGTKGDLLYDENKELITHQIFGEGKVHQTKVTPAPGGHGGGDDAVVRAWLHAIATRDTSRILTDARESLKTHRIVFAAEQSRVEGRMVELQP
jgi:predicted dehydrogenase